MEYMFKKITFAAVLASVLLPVAALAEDAMTPPDQTGIRAGARMEILQDRQDLKVQATTNRAQLKTDLQVNLKERMDAQKAAMNQLDTQAKAIKADTSLTTEQKQAQIQVLRKQTLETRQENQQKFVEDRQAIVKEAQDKRQTLRDDFKTKVAGIKDAAKKQLASKIGDRLQETNTDATTKLADTLTKINNALTSITAKLAAVPAGTDTTTLQADITAATTAVADAQVSVTAQTAMTYTLPTTTTDSTAKADFAKLTQQLRTDLQAVQTKVQAARQAVTKAYQDLVALNIK